MDKKVLAIYYTQSGQMSRYHEFIHRSNDPGRCFGGKSDRKACYRIFFSLDRQPVFLRHA